MKKLYTKYDIYNSHCYFIQYNENYFKVVLVKYQREKGFEPINNNKNLISNSYESSLSRTKRNIKELALCNGFEYFSTITINSNNCNRYDLFEVQNLLHKKLKKIKRKYKDFKFLYITEKHKDGAFHFHGLVKNIPLYINNNGYFSCKILDEIGFNSFSKIKDYNKCCNYIMKYITKDCIRNEHNQIYFCSRGLKKADKYEIPFIDIHWKFENDFVKISEFSAEELDREDVFKIFGLNNPKNFEKYNPFLEGFFYRM